MNRKEKKVLLKKNLLKNVEFIVNGTLQNINATLVFGGMYNNVFKDLSLGYRIGNLPTKSLNDLGFYVNSNGFVKVDLNNDNIYFKGGQLVVERQ
jgi:hypothetical protein